MSEYKLKKSFSRTGIGVDLAKYQAMLDAPEATEDEKRSFVESMWRIMVTFVDLGFELHPLSFPCGQLPNHTGSDCEEAQHMLDLEEILKNRFEEATMRDRQHRGEEHKRDS